MSVLSSGSPRPVPVRKLDNDGYLTVHYLLPDGTETDDLPDDLLLGANPHHITAIWEPQYKLFGGVDYWRYEGRENMLYLSKANPFLFEEVLCFLESAPHEQQAILSRRIIRSSMHPTDERPNVTYFDYYRAMIDNIPLLVELSRDALVGTHTTHAHKLFTDARKIFKRFDHPHFRAGVLANWIMQRHTGKRVIVQHEESAEDLAYIDAHFQQVFDVRDDLARLGCIDRAGIASLLGTPKPVRDGAL